MRSFIFNGVDFGALTRAKVVAESALSVRAETASIPGRAGEVVLDVALPPKVVRLKVFLEPMMKCDSLRIDALRHELHAALLAMEPCELQYQENYVYREVLCTDVTAWDSMFESGTCEIEFTCFDPIAYSHVMRVEAGSSFVVGGTWPTWPVMEFVAAAGGEVSVLEGNTGRHVTVSRTFADGDIVVLDFEHETCTVNGMDASADIEIGSDFFQMQTIYSNYQFTGCKSHAVRFYERWV